TDDQARQDARTACEEFNRIDTRRPGRRADDHYAGRPGFDAAAEQGWIFVGSPATVRARLGHWLDVAGGNYFVGVFAFGNLTTERILGSIRLFAEEVMPALSTGARSEPAGG